MNRHPLTNFLTALSLVALTALWCGYYNRFAMENYYGSLVKPFLTPPDYIFPIVWAVLYILLIIAFDFILNGKNSSFAVKLFMAVLLLQIFWSYLFFYKGLFLVGFAVIAVKCFVTAATLNEFYHRNRFAGLLLVPYLLWVLFAAYLNWGVADLNGAVAQF